MFTMSRICLGAVKSDFHRLAPPTNGWQAPEGSKRKQDDEQPADGG